MMATEATLARFQPHVRSPFRLEPEGRDAVELELIEAQGLGAGRDGGREPFSLIFRGPATVPLGQGTYPLEHDALGPIALFLVPIGPEGDPLSLHYQAIFN